MDRFTKYWHFMALAHPYAALEVAQVFLGLVFKLHSFPKTIMSDKDSLFLSLFWKGLFALYPLTSTLPVTPKVMDRLRR